MNIKYPIIRRAILKTLAPVLRWVGTIHTKTDHAVSNLDCLAMLETPLRAGDIFLTYASGHLTNLVIPGDWKHVAMYAGSCEVIEAVGKGVVVNSIASFTKTKDRIMVLRPTFCDTETQAQAVVYAKTLIGKPYDFLVEYSLDSRVNKAFYCSEIPWWSYNRAMIASGKESPFQPRLTMGALTITPQDYANSVNKWTRLGQWPGATI